MRVAAPQLLPAAARAAQPWKNGGGITREVAAHPPGSDLDSFAWRVSLAEVNAGGPFSQFAGVDRRMAVLAGTLEFTLAGQALQRLTAESEPVAFAGDAAAAAAPGGGTVTDLNVMTRRGRFESRLGRRRGPQQLVLTADTVLILALTPLAVRCAEAHRELTPLDALRFDGAVRCQVTPGAAGAYFYLVELRQI
ncbi:MAG TPA: HutD family protein [Steroidobacteraceae bacterium]|nr:HutD family protein [Steroidobacteraceae bacterium]